MSVIFAPNVTARTTTRDDRPVLATAPLKPGFDRADLCHYDDPSWDLGPAVFRENARRCHVTVHFGAVDDPAIAAALREYLYARLNVDLPGHRRRLPPASARQAFNRTRRFFSFVAVERGHFDLAGVDQTLVDRYAKSLASVGLRPIVAAQALEPVFDLHACREHLPTARLSFEPWPGRSPSLVAGYRFGREENRTPRIPETIIAPLLTWSLRYLAVFAPDIFAARAEMTALLRRRGALLAADADLSGRDRWRKRRERLATFLERQRADGRGVPIWTTAHNGVLRQDRSAGGFTPPINAQLLHLHMGIDSIAEPGDHFAISSAARSLVDAAVAEIGIEVSGMDTPVSSLPGTELPWRPRFDAKTLMLEERMLQAACYVVCAYLTGMRDGEVQAMRSGCLSLTRSEDGIITRHRVRSVSYKNKSSVGEPGDWITIAPVADAVRVLEQLSARPPPPAVSIRSGR